MDLYVCKMHICDVTVISHILDFMAKIRRIFITWLADSEQIFQHFKSLFSTKIHYFYVKPLLLIMIVDVSHTLQYYQPWMPC